MKEQESKIILAKDLPAELRGQVIVHLPKKDPEARKELRVDCKKQTGDVIAFNQDGQLFSLGPKSRLEIILYLSK